MEKQTYGTAGQFFDSALYGPHVYERAGFSDDFGGNIRDALSDEPSDRPSGNRHSSGNPQNDIHPASDEETSRTHTRSGEETSRTHTRSGEEASRTHTRSGDETSRTHGEENASRTLLLRNRQTGEVFFIRRTRIDPKYRRAYFQRVLEGPRVKNGILWPVDMVELPENVLHECALFVDREYAPEQTPVRERSDNCALAFPLPPFPTLSVPELLRVLEQEPFSLRPIPLVDIRGWKNPNIRLFAVHLARIVMLLNECGFLYNEFDLSRIRLHQSFSIYGICPPEHAALFLDYSNLLCSTGGRQADDAFLTIPRDHNYPLEFGDPAVVNRRVKRVDLQSQNYSLCAFLFWLFFRRHPYDGALVSGWPDDTPWNQDAKYRACHRVPVFIFDPDDTSNQIGAFEEEQETLTLWAAAPDELREPFLRTLAGTNALRETPPDNPGPEDWLKLFRKLHWNMDVNL